MAHLIDNSKGFNAFVSFQKAAWHGLGKVFTNAISTEQALQEAGLDFGVIKLPNVHMLPNGEEIISDSSFFTCRTDVFKVLGDKLGSQYTVMQNAEALNIVDEILQAGTATIETAGAIDGGKKVFICMKLNNPITVDGSDIVNQYLVIATGHDGLTAHTALPTNIRVVCNNTLSAALRGAHGAIKIRHSANAADKFKEAMRILKVINDNTAINEDNYNEMKALQISKEQMFDYFGNLFFNAEEMKELKEGKHASKVLSTRKQNQINDVLRFATKGIGQAETLASNGELTMWSAYNGVTGYLTGRRYKNADQRADSMLFGSTATLIKEAGELALMPNKIQTLRKVNFNDLGLN